MSARDEIIEIIVDQLGVDRDDVTPEKSFIEDLNADSLDLTELMMTIEERFKKEIPQRQVEGLKTVGDLIRYVESELQ